MLEEISYSAIERLERRPYLEREGIYLMTKAEGNRHRLQERKGEGQAYILLTCLLRKALASWYCGHV